MRLRPYQVSIRFPISEAPYSRAAKRPPGLRDAPNNEYRNTGTRRMGNPRLRQTMAFMIIIVLKFTASLLSGNRS
jgi:hypothetical protein